MPTINYATVEDIRMKAGFEKATNLADRYVTAARRDAQAEIDTACANLYDVPFNPVPEKIATLTIKLAAYTLKHDAFGDKGSENALKALREQLKKIASGEVPLTDDAGESLSSEEGVTGFFGESERMFSVEQKF